MGVGKGWGLEEQLFGWEMGEAGHFLSKDSFDFVVGLVGEGELLWGWGMGRSITIVGTQCLSRVKLYLAFFWVDTLKTLKSYADQHFKKNF